MVNKKFAYRTKVPVAQSRNEIDNLLTRYGADSLVIGRDDRLSITVIQFRANDRYYRFQVPINNDDPAEERRLWRSLVLSIKGKLEIVASGIATFEEEFLAHTVLPDGQTAIEWIEPQLQLAYSSGEMPDSLLALPAPSSPRS